MHDFQTQFADGRVPGASDLQISQLHETLKKISSDLPVAVYFAAGARAHTAVRLLRQHGFEAANLAGGYTTWCYIHA